MDNAFLKKGYKVIELNLGDEDLLVKSFEKIVKENNITQDYTIQIVSPLPINVLLEPAASKIHKERLTSIVEKETGLELFPTFCYTRKYLKGSTLSPHVDNNACEISLSYSISGPEWEIKIGSNTVTTKIGNGVIYRGCDLVHERSKPSSDEVIQVFNHWVTLSNLKNEFQQMCLQYNTKTEDMLNILSKGIQKWN